MCVIIGEVGEDQIITDNTGETNNGRAYVYLGSAAGLSTTPAWTYESDQAGAALGAGTAVAGIGDVNGDGYPDIIIGEPRCSGGETNEGRGIVYDALSLIWSNGQVEGRVNRLKFIKRMMYGRANFDLLRKRVLLSASDSLISRKTRKNLV